MSEHFVRQFNKRSNAAGDELAPKQSSEIEIPVEQWLNCGLTFMASNEISATLYNDKGAIVGKNLTNTSESNAWFRSIFVDKDVTAGTWKILPTGNSKRLWQRGKMPLSECSLVKTNYTDAGENSIKIVKTSLFEIHRYFFIENILRGRFFDLYRFYLCS